MTSFYYCSVNHQSGLQSNTFSKLSHIFLINHTANMCSGITVEVQLKNCTFDKLQFLTVDHSSLYFLQVKNCIFSIIFNVVYFAWN